MANKITSNLMYAACNLKDFNSSGITGTIEFDARPGHPTTVTGVVTGLSEGDHSFQAYATASIEDSCDGAAGASEDIGIMTADKDGKSVIHIYDSKAELDSDNGDHNIQDRALVINTTKEQEYRVACCVISHQQAKDNGAANMAGVINGNFKVTRRQAELFMIGLISGLLEKDDLTILEKCVRASDKVMNDVTAIVDNLHEGLNVTNIVKAVSQVGDLTQTVPDELKKCPSLSGDANRLSGWGRQFVNAPWTFMAKATGRVMKNIVSIFGDMAAMIGDLIRGQWEQGGLDFGDICELVLGKLPKVNEDIMLTMTEGWEYPSVDSSNFGLY